MANTSLRGTGGAAADQTPEIVKSEVPLAASSEVAGVCEKTSTKCVKIRPLRDVLRDASRVTASSTSTSSAAQLPPPRRLSRVGRAGRNVSSPPHRISAVSKQPAHGGGGAKWRRNPAEAKGNFNDPGNGRSPGSSAAEGQSRGRIVAGSRGLQPKSNDNDPDLKHMQDSEAWSDDDQINLVDSEEEISLQGSDYPMMSHGQPRQRRQRKGNLNALLAAKPPPVKHQVISES
ncbi:unnamed protein product [Closterium sp. NIES-54]